MIKEYDVFDNFRFSEAFQECVEDDLRLIREPDCRTPRHSATTRPPSTR